MNEQAAPHESARPARPEDRPILVALLHDAAASIGSRPGSHLFGHPARSSTPDARLDALEVDPEGIVGAGLIDEAVVGVILARIRVNAFGRAAVVEELYVEAAAREVGVGEALVRFVVDWAASLACTEVDIDVLPGDRRTKNLLERTGFRARSLTMHRPL